MNDQLLTNSNVFMILIGTGGIGGLIGGLFALIGQSGFKEYNQFKCALYKNLSECGCTLNIDIYHKVLSKLVQEYPINIEIFRYLHTIKYYNLTDLMDVSDCEVVNNIGDDYTANVDHELEVHGVSYKRTVSNRTLRYLTMFNKLFPSFFWIVMKSYWYKITGKLTGYTEKKQKIKTPLSEFKKNPILESKK